MMISFRIKSLTFLATLIEYPGDHVVERSLPSGRKPAFLFTRSYCSVFIFRLATGITLLLK